jgi:hypothetical protein
MYEKIKLLIAELKAENEERNKALNSPNISDYSHTVKVHTYNNTLDIIKRLEKIVN